jgi:hypothetical protein
MKDTTIKLVLNGHIFLAYVTAIEHDKFVEYHITPHDETLKALYGTQSIAVYPDRPYQSSITAKGKESKEYSRALLTGLHSLIYNSL